MWMGWNETCNSLDFSCVGFLFFFSASVPNTHDSGGISGNTEGKITKDCHWLMCFMHLHGGFE